MTEIDQVVDLRSLPPTRRSQALALVLFDHAGAAHQLPMRGRRLLQQAAAYYSAAQQADGERPDRLGRDLALAAPIGGLRAADQAIVASAVAFQREKLHPNREPSFLRLDEKNQRTALRLAAILRIASAVEDQSLDLQLVSGEEDAFTLIVEGAHAAETIAAVEKRAQLWREAIGPLTVRAAEPGEVAAARRLATNGSAGGERPLAPLDQPIGGAPIAEAARRQLRRFFDKLLAREEAVIKDEDSEDVHQMRVATRRLRASLQVVEGVYDHTLIQRYRRGLQRIAQSLGAVRDGDVFLEHVTSYRESLPEADRARLDPLITAVANERARARAQLLNDLATKRYQKFKREFSEFLTTPGGGALDSPEPGITERVRDFAGSAIWRRYELWRTYETVLPNATSETLHQARIAGKRLRYTLEFFAEALGPKVDQLLTPLTAVQENLGTLQDGVTARSHIATLGLAEDAGAQEYLASREQEHVALLAELPQRWEQVDSATYRRKLFGLIVKL